MLESIKKALSDNWKGAIVGAVAVALVMLGLPAEMVLKVSGNITDEDVRAELCADYEPAPEEADEEAPAETDAGVEEEAKDAGSADAGKAADSE